MEGWGDVEYEKPISVNLSHVEKDVENALILRGFGSRGGQRFFRGFEKGIFGCPDENIITSF